MARWSPVHSFTFEWWRVAGARVGALSDLCVLKLFGLVGVFGYVRLVAAGASPFS